mmetsp:Transcript_11464/g.28460  ORF Transcript_11464/g.28460 Transcript_11464/m.28460 type:complete len:210 (+) Transcript_11464:712-1341(+)
MPPRPSRNVPCKSKECMDVGTSPNLSGIAVPTICVKAIPKTYKIMQSKQRVKKTDRLAAIMPLTMINNSGTTRNNRTMRAMRESRNNRAVLMTPMFPTKPDPPDASKIALMIQVSRTMKITSMESNTNQQSLKQFHLLANDMNLQVHSKQKNMQKACSIIWKTASASMIISASFSSVSIQIQNALNAMTPRVIFSNNGCTAICGHTPSL